MIRSYFLSAYKNQPVSVTKKAHIFVNTLLASLFFMLIVFGAHLIGELPFYILTLDVLFSSIILINLHYLKIKRFETAVNINIFSLLLIISLDFLLRDYLAVQHFSHLRFLESEVLLIGCLFLISLYALKIYQIFLFLIPAFILILAHFVIIISKSYGGNFKGIPLADFIIYGSGFLFTGFLAVYMFRLQEKLIKGLEQESDKVKDMNNNLQILVAERTEKLESQNEELMKANQELDKFVYKVSHDLRSPLVSAMGLISLIKEEKNIATQANYVQLLGDLIIKLDTLIKDILDLSSNSRSEAEREEIDFQNLIADVFAYSEFNQTEAQIEKIVEITQNKAFFSDKKRISIILNNLVSNAIRYSVERKEKSFVSIKIKCANGAAKIIVEDNGQGIDKQHIDKIFDMFYRATDKKQGTGLGLYIVKESLNKIKGNIQVNSELDKGTQFMLEIPNLKN